MRNAHRLATDAYVQLVTLTPAQQLNLEKCTEPKIFAIDTILMNDEKRHDPSMATSIESDEITSAKNGNQY